MYFLSFQDFLKQHFVSLVNKGYFLGGPRINKKPDFLEKNRKNHLKRKNSKTSRDMP